jgi:hypothetical protein
MNNVVYQITSPNLPYTFYVGSSTNLKERWSQHKGRSNNCTSKAIVLAGDAFIEAIEIVPPSENPIRHDLEDCETLHILRLRAQGMHVVNQHLPGSQRRRAYTAAPPIDDTYVDADTWHQMPRRDKRVVTTTVRVVTTTTATVYE